MNKKSPLEKLVEIQQNQYLPTKIIPKDRLATHSQKIITPIIEDGTPAHVLDSIPGLSIANSSLVVSVNLNIDSDAMDKAIKGVAAAGAAMIGTAIFLGSQSRAPSKTKVTLMPNIRVPKIKQ